MPSYSLRSATRSTSSRGSPRRALRPLLLEISFGQWSLKTEYLFYDLGQETLTAPFLIGGVPEPFTFRPEFDTQGHILRIGTNFPLN